MNNKELVNKAVWMRESTLEKLRVLASIEKQSLSEWVTWAIDKGYEAKIYQNRPHLNEEKESSTS